MSADLPVETAITTTAVPPDLPVRATCTLPAAEAAMTAAIWAVPLLCTTSAVPLSRADTAGVVEEAATVVVAAGEEVAVATRCGTRAKAAAAVVAGLTDCLLQYWGLNAGWG